MSSPRHIKILRDLWLNLPRSLLVILAISIGIFGTGFVLDAYSILAREINANYKLANPQSATLWMNVVDADALNAARSFPGISDADKTGSIVRSRVEVGADEWDILQLNVVDDFGSIRISKFFPVTGSWPPGDHQILIERASLPVIGAKVGSAITVRTLSGPVRELAVSGAVFDPGQDPAWVNNIACGYITPGALQWLGGPVPQAGLRIVVGDGVRDRAHIRDIADKLGAALGQRGYQVERIEVPIPGKYPQTDKINSLLLTLVMFGFLCLVLSGFMTATLVSGLLSRQIRQIGVMKALGAGTRQTMGIYLGTVSILSLAALAIGIPLGAAVGQAFSQSVMDMLNFNMASRAIPLWATALQAGAGLFVPLLTAAYPIYRGSRITVREAIGDYGVNTKDFGAGRMDKLLERIRLLPRELALSLRNSFRSRGRLVLALAMLALGGASFIASLGSAASWNRTIDNAFSHIGYDIDIRFGGSYSIGAIETAIRPVPGVAAVEAWGYSMSTSFPKYSDGTYGGATVIFAPPKGTSMVTPPLIEGRWLQAGDTNAVVVDTDFVDNAAKQGTPVKLGDGIVFSIGGTDTAWHVVGIMDKVGFQSAAYVDYDYFSSITGQQGMAACARVAVNGHDKALRKSVSQALEQKLGQDGFRVFVIQDLSLTRQVMVNHVILILSLLMFMSVLVAAVGALGLASTIGMNVMDRTREIGIMRSIGATAGAIARTVILEGVLTAFMSWILAVILSVPLTGFIAGNTGQFVFPRIMAVAYPLWAPALWLGIVLAVAAAASFYPARRAARLTIREVLAYE